MSDHRSVIATLSVGLFALGVLVGTLVALSAQSLAQAVIALLFAMFGGSLLALFQKLAVPEQIKVAAGILAISLGTLAGVYSGIFVTEHQILTPTSRRFTQQLDDGKGKTTKGQTYLYLRENSLNKVNEIDQKYRTKLLSPEEAYEQLHSALTEDQK